MSEDTDVIENVQVFVDGAEVVVELWGKTTVISPKDEHHVDHEFQDNSWTKLSDLSWHARRIVYGVTESGNADDTIQFKPQYPTHEVAGIAGEMNGAIRPLPSALSVRNVILTRAYGT